MLAMIGAEKESKGDTQRGFDILWPASLDVLGYTPQEVFRLYANRMYVAHHVTIQSTCADSY